jgi:uncharacterized protein (TIGR02147 family)
MPPREKIPLSDFDLIADYWHFAIIHLSEIKGCPSDPAWIAAKLGITLTQVNKSLKILIENGYVEKKNGFLKSKKKNFITTDDIPSEAIKRNHSQGLELAQEALYEVEVEKREYRSLTLAVNEEDLDECKEFIRKFYRDFNKKFGHTEANEVYRLQLQLYPLTKAEKKKRSLK